MESYEEFKAKQKKKERRELWFVGCCLVMLFVVGFFAASSMGNFLSAGFTEAIAEQKEESNKQFDALLESKVIRSDMKFDVWYAMSSEEKAACIIKEEK